MHFTCRSNTVRTNWKFDDMTVSSLISCCIYQKILEARVKFNYFSWTFPTVFKEYKFMDKNYRLIISQLLLTLYLLVSSADNFSIQFRPRSGRTICRA